MPDQLIILLAVCSVGFIPYRDGVVDILRGGAISFSIVFMIAVIGKISYRKDILGGGDIKLFTAIGFICGSFGSIFIILAMSIISAAHMIYLLIRGNIKIKGYVPMGPYIALSTGIYLMFFWDH